MASIRKEIEVNASTGKVWPALRDFGALHTRLAKGFVADTQLEDDGQMRIVTFVNGSVMREHLVDIDDGTMRLVYGIAPNERIAHYSASAQVVADGADKCRFIWTVDMLPGDLAPYISEQMDLGCAAMKKTLEEAA